MDSNKFKYGIVFCGGGAKGAYQIGVWKRLKELGMDKEIIGVSGASIGAMNSILFAQGDYDMAEKVWMQTEKTDLKTFNPSLLGNLLKSKAISKAIAPVLTGAMGGIGAASAGIMEPLIFAGMGVKEVMQTGLYTREKLANIIRNAVDPLRITKTNKQVYTALTSLPELQSEYRSWRGLTYDEIVETVLASAALPLAYPTSIHKGKTYTDGGVLDNTPVKPLRDAGFRNIIVVHLDTLSRRKQQKKEEMVDTQGSGWVKFMHIWPSASLGDKLKISTDLTRRRINLGYMDTQSQLVPAT